MLSRPPHKSESGLPLAYARSIRIAKPPTATHVSRPDTGLSAR